MPKKSNKNENRRLRREVEMLKAQLKSTGQVVTKTATNQTVETDTQKPSNGILIDPKLVKKDLLKTFILSAIAFGIIFSLYLTA